MTFCRYCDTGGSTGNHRKASHQGAQCSVLAWALNLEIVREDNNVENEKYDTNMLEVIAIVEQWNT